MAITLVQKNGGSVNLNASMVTSLGGATTAGNTILIFVNGAGTFTTPSGFASRSSQVNQQGFYLFEKLAAAGDATDTPTITQSGAFNGTWQIVEYSGIAAFDTSNGNNAGNTPNGSITTPTITPTSGIKVVVAGMAVLARLATDTFAAGDPQSWTNSFVGEQSNFQSGAGGGTGDSGMCSGWADFMVTADGVTGYSTAASFTESGGQGAPATIIAAYTGTAPPVQNPFANQARRTFM